METVPLEARREEMNPLGVEAFEVSPKDFEACKEDTFGHIEGKDCIKASMLKEKMPAHTGCSSGRNVVWAQICHQKRLLSCAQH